MSAKKPTANLREAAQQALEALEIAMKTPINEYLPREPLDAIKALRAALADTQDWDELEALRASLREHMAEIHRLRAAGRQALDAMDYTRRAVADYAQKWGIPRYDRAMNTLRAALAADTRICTCHPEDNPPKPCQRKYALSECREAALAEEQNNDTNTLQSTDGIPPRVSDRADRGVEIVTNCHEKEGDKLSPPSERKDLSEESLNELVAQLKAATADRDARIKPTHMVFTGDSLDYLKKLADERNADTGETSDVPETNFGIMAQAVDPTEDDHIADANKMVASVRENRTVEPVAWAVITKSGKLYKAASTKESAERKAQQQIDKLGAEWECSVVPLYTAPPKREPLTDEQIRLIDSGTHFHESSDWSLRFARAIERAHGIGGEE